MSVLSLGLAHLVVAAAVGGLGVPMGLPPAPEDPVLASVASEDCLFYTSWSGVASPDAKSRNQTEQLLAEPEIQNFLGQIDRCIGKAFEEIRKNGDKSILNSGLFPIAGYLAACAGVVYGKYVLISKLFCIG